MKTAEDILNEVVGWSNEIAEEMCYEAMKQYAKQACREQKRLCSENAKILVRSELNETEFDMTVFGKGKFKEIVTVSRDSILNANEPQLE